MRSTNWTITCGKCGHNADIDAWARTEIAGELPRDTYQCPECRCAFKLRLVKPKWKDNGTLTGPVELVPVEARW